MTPSCPLGAVPRYYYSKTSPPFLAPHCTGDESSLFNCTKSVCRGLTYNHAGVMCLPGMYSNYNSRSESMILWELSNNPRVHVDYRINMIYHSVYILPYETRMSSSFSIQIICYILAWVIISSLDILIETDAI